MALERLAEVDSDRITVLVVWVPIWDGEMEPKAVGAANELEDQLHDPRLLQFWTDDLAIPRAFADPLGWGDGNAEHAWGPVPWDLHALYPAGVRWKEQPPAPIDWVSPVVRDADLGAKLRSLVPKA